MAKTKKGYLKGPFNEVDSPDPNTPDGSPYFGYDEVHAMHGKSGEDCCATPNSEAMEGVTGGPAPGEPEFSK
jgi:hypothetical protein